MARITMKVLEGMISELNKRKGYPEKGYSQDDNCKGNPQYFEYRPGYYVSTCSYSLDAAYGGYALHKHRPGGTSMDSITSYMTARQLYERLQGMM